MCFFFEFDKIFRQISALEGHRDLYWMIMLFLLSPPLIFFSFQISRSNSLLEGSYFGITMMFHFITIFKMTIIRMTFGETQNLMNYFNAHVFHRDDPVCYQLRRKEYFITWKIFFAIGSYVTLNGLAHIFISRPISPYIGIHSAEVRWFHYLVVQMVSISALLHQSIYMTSILIVSFLMHWFQVELKIVATAFGMIFHDKPPRPLKKGQNSERIRLQREEIHWTGIERRLIYCISRHGEIVELIKQLRKIAQPIFFALGFYIVTTISTLIFVIIKDRHFNILGVVHVVATIAEFYYYAHLIDDLDERNHMIANALYAQNWAQHLRYSEGQFAKHYKSCKTMILIAIMHSQRPFRFTCGGLYKMTLSVFTVLIETLYFAITFMFKTIKIKN
ncbi:uncharacterized protein LOC129745120 [Uranotaenia lowii]|uniref:uncharacterized protein LOC129745120 n=1 Tax=Uranotaenia lowii TaxID=190385 RepID=UPI00247B1A56|nr:uncharacterized protein LOC129745120 [Uranotaenia lowii]